MKKIIAITFLLFTLAGCSEEDTLPTETPAPIEVIKPTETQPVETSAVKETVPDIIIDSLDDLPITEIEVITVDEDGNIQSKTDSTEEIGEIHINPEDEQIIKDYVYENQSNSEIKSFTDIAEDYVNTSIEERNTSEINHQASEKIDIEDESNAITDEMHDELQAEIDAHNRAQAEASFEKYKEQLEAYYKD